MWINSHFAEKMASSLKPHFKYDTAQAQEIISST
jgi:hypothetical protein